MAAVGGSAFDGTDAAGVAEAAALAAAGAAAALAGFTLEARAAFADGALTAGAALDVMPPGEPLFTEVLRALPATLPAAAALAADAAALRALAQLARLGASSLAVAAAGDAGVPAAAFEPLLADEEGAAVADPFGVLAAAGAGVAGAVGLAGPVGAIFDFGLLVLPGDFCAAASLVAAALREAVLAIGTRAASRTAAASAAGAAAAGAAGASVDAAALGAGAGGGEVKSSSTTGSSSSSSAGASGAFVSGAALTTGIALMLWPGARNISGSTKLSPVASVNLDGSAPAPAFAVASAAPGAAVVAGEAVSPPATLALVPSGGSSTGRSGSNSSGGRAASI